MSTEREMSRPLLNIAINCSCSNSAKNGRSQKSNGTCHVITPNYIYTRGHGELQTVFKRLWEKRIHPTFIACKIQTAKDSSKQEL